MALTDTRRGEVMMRWILGAIALSLVLAYVLKSWLVLPVTAGLIAWAIIQYRKNKITVFEAIVVEFAGNVVGFIGHLGADGPYFLDSMVAVASGGTPSAALLRRRLGVDAERSERMMAALEQMVIVSERGSADPQILDMEPAMILAVVKRAKLLSAGEH